MKTFYTYEGIYAENLPATNLEKEIRDFYKNNRLLGQKNQFEAKQRQFRLIERAADRISDQKLGDLPEARKTILKNLENIYDKMKDDYETMTIDGEEEDIKFLSLIANYLEPNEKFIVDGCCGTGLDITALAKIKSDRQFIGYDMSKKLIERANERKKRLGMKNLQFIIAEQSELPFANETADVLIMKNTAVEESLLPEIQEYYRIDSSIPYVYEMRWRDIYRILKPNGTYITFQNFPIKPWAKLPGLKYQGRLIW